MNKNALWLSRSIGACCKFPEGYGRDRKLFQQAQPARSHWETDHGVGYKSCFGAVAGTLSRALRSVCWALAQSFAVWDLSSRLRFPRPLFSSPSCLRTDCQGCSCPSFCPSAHVLSASLSNCVSLSSALNSDLLRRVVLGWSRCPPPHQFKCWSPNPPVAQNVTTLEREVHWRDDYVKGSHQDEVLIQYDSCPSKNKDHVRMEWGGTICKPRREKPWGRPNLPAPRSWISSFQNCKKRNVQAVVCSYGSPSGLMQEVMFGATSGCPG